MKLPCFLCISWAVKDQSAVPPHDKDFKSHLSRVYPRILYLFLLRMGLLTVQDLRRPEKKAHLYLILQWSVKSAFVPWAKPSFPSLCQASIPLHNHAHACVKSEMKISERRNTQDSKQNRWGSVSTFFSSIPHSCHQPAITCISKYISVPPMSLNSFW